MLGGCQSLYSDYLSSGVMPGCGVFVYFLWILRLIAALLNMLLKVRQKAGKAGEKTRIRTAASSRTL